MRLTTAFGCLAVAVHAAAQGPPPSAPATPGPANVRVTARIVVVDRGALARAGLSYVVVGNDRVRVRASRRSGSGGAGIRAGVHGVEVFLDVARQQRWIRSESTQQVLTLDGSEAVVASTELAVTGFGARTRGPSLAVVPRVLGDGAIHLGISARQEDRVTYAWGGGVDGSPAAVETAVVVRQGEEVVVAGSSAVRSAREVGLLRWSGAERGRDVLVAVSAEVASR